MLSGRREAQGALLKADLSQADLTGADLKGAHLMDAKLSGACLANADLRKANLTCGARSGEPVRGQVTTPCSMAPAGGGGPESKRRLGYGFTERRCTRRSVALSERSEDARDRGATLGKPVTVLHYGVGIWNTWRRESGLQTLSLKGEELSWAALLNADFSNVNLSGCNLLGVNLHGADLRGATLGNANLSEAKLVGACLDGADLTGLT